jgi:hypothetical protein
MHQLAGEAGYELDWGKTAIGAKERNGLYVARDLAVIERAFPGLTPEKAMQTNDRTEYEASFVLEALRRQVGDRHLAEIIRVGLSPKTQFEHQQDPAEAPAGEPDHVPEFSKAERAEGPASRSCARGSAGRQRGQLRSK